MPLTVITVTNVPSSLKGDLTKWMQEIATGVFIGNFNTKIREQLWNRVKKSVGRGQATLSYNHQNELGYKFETFQANRIIRDYDGIQMVYFPKEDNINISTVGKGFSTASKLRNAKKYSRKKEHRKSEENQYVVLDIETDGLDISFDNIIEIGAIKVNGADCKMKLNM
jgi:CRISPR-associated protein Cas2